MLKKTDDLVRQGIPKKKKKNRYSLVSIFLEFCLCFIHFNIGILIFLNLKYCAIFFADEDALTGLIGRLEKSKRVSKF